MIDIALIAGAAIGNILVPFFQRGAEKVAGDLGDAVGEAAADHATQTATSLWERIKAKLSGSDEGRMIAERFERDPESAAPLLEQDLKAQLEQDPAFAEEVAQLLAAEGPAGSGNVIKIFGAGNVVDARYSRVDHGFIAAHVGGVYNSPTQARPGPAPGPDED